MHSLILFLPKCEFRSLACKHENRFIEADGSWKILSREEFVKIMTGEFKQLKASWTHSN